MSYVKNFPENILRIVQAGLADNSKNRAAAMMDLSHDAKAAAVVTGLRSIIKAKPLKFIGPDDIVSTYSNAAKIIGKDKMDRFLFYKTIRTTLKPRSVANRLTTDNESQLHQALMTNSRLLNPFSRGIDKARENWINSDEKGEDVEEDIPPQDIPLPDSPPDAQAPPADAEAQTSDTNIMDAISQLIAERQGLDPDEIGDAVAQKMALMGAIPQQTPDIQGTDEPEGETLPTLPFTRADPDDVINTTIAYITFNGDIPKKTQSN